MCDKCLPTQHNNVLVRFDVRPDGHTIIMIDSDELGSVVSAKVTTSELKAFLEREK